jgi:hypothetical protein
MKAWTHGRIQRNMRHVTCYKARSALASHLNVRRHYSMVLELFSVTVIKQGIKHVLKLRCGHGNHTC